MTNNNNSSNISISTTGNSSSNTTATITTVTATTTTTMTNVLPDRSSGSGTRTTARRQSTHSIIEKRRRERINDKIQQLKEIIPTCNPHSEQPIRGPSFHQPLHKLAILEAAIAYIEQMHQTLLEAPPSAVQGVDPKISKVLQHARQCQRQKS